MELFLILVCLIAPPTLSLSIKSKLNPRIVQTRYGEVQGVVRSFENAKFLKPIDVYLGIPYATPPIGGNRFSPTKAPSPWEGVRLSDSISPVCPQKLPDISNEQEALERMPKGRLEYLKRLLPHLRNQSEDCLYLNIYAPAMDIFRYKELRIVKGTKTKFPISSIAFKQTDTCENTLDICRNCAGNHEISQF